MKVLIVALSLVISAYAQVPTPCESPKQWEAREIRQDYQEKFFEYRKLSYDETNKRIREVEEVVIGNDKNYYDRIYLFNENKNYSLDLRTKKCTVTPLTRSFMYRGVRPGAKFDFFFEIGATGVPGESVQIQAWSLNSTEGFYTGLVTYPSCIPVQNIYYSKMYGFAHSDYFDISVGIPDINVFVPPTECMMAEKKLRQPAPIV